ncbi:hypothetical protein HDV05_002706, partial [Chytridiales sp. JEL 0842]
MLQDIPQLTDPTLSQIEDAKGDLGRSVLHLISKIESNGFGVWVQGKKKKESVGAEDATGCCVGRAVFPLASFFNHSCEPTCECIQISITMTIRTLRPLKQGEELSISYINTLLPLASRRSILSQDYFFECGCTRCKREAGMKPGERAKVTFVKSVRVPKAKNKRTKKGKGESERVESEGFNELEVDSDVEGLKDGVGSLA